MNRTTTLGILFTIIVSHIVLAATYAGLTPYRQSGFLVGQRDPNTGSFAQVQDVGAPDERQHANYVTHLRQGKGFPVFNPQDPNLYESYQSHQPPAYYLLAQAWTGIMGAGSLEERAGGLKLRALNVVIGSITVAGVFFLGYWGYRRAEVGLVAAAFAALLPMHAALCGAVSNDPLLIALGTWVLALCAKGIREGWSVPLAVGVGLLTGVAMLTKTTALALLPALLVAAFIRQEHRPKLAVVAVVAALAILLPLPWWLRNQTNYGDPFAISAFNQAFVNSAQASTLIQAMGAMTYWTEWVAWWTMRSFVGVFGYMDIWLTNTGTRSGEGGMYLMVLLLIAASFLGWLLAAKAHSESQKGDRSVRLLNGVFALVVLLLFIRFNGQYFQAQARYLFPAIGPIACGVAIGLLQLLKNRVTAALVVVAAVLGGVNLFAVSKLPAEFAKRANIVQAP